ncbi:MAG: LacI family DNA-binding transcriptional regulator [Candidatus Cryptobacteroides sp.]|nr:LacI family DNA-binding transcriptional regulator [Bacteroidales bacterium]
MKRITIRDVAREAKVSVTLVSFVMNAKRDKDGNLDCPVNPETAKRVLQVAQKLGYRRNFAAASLRSGRSNSIAVIPNDISNKFFAGVSRCIEDKAKSYGYTVLFASSDENADRLANVMDAVLAHNIDGVIVAPCTGGDAAVRKAIDCGVPVVLLDRDIDGMDNVGKVLLDDVEAGSMATDLFIKRGYRKIEMISYSLGISSLEERESGYRKSMMDNDLYDNARVHYTTYAKAAEDVPVIIKDAVSRGVEAIFLPTYSLSALVLMTMRDLGLRTPEDMAVIGFDVSDIYQLYSTSVTHIVQPLKELGEKSVDVLINMIHDKPAEKVVLKPEMIEGNSTAPKK